jgi:hypothetical protein
MGTTRREFLTTAVTAAGAAVSNLAHAAEAEHDHLVATMTCTRLGLLLQCREAGEAARSVAERVLFTA